MAPAGGDSSDKNAEITMQLRLWAKRDGTGRTFDSSGGFLLPNGATRSPDASWVNHDRLAALTAEERAKFLPLCPDFVIELRSPTDGLSALQDKMREYMENGAQLGWLIDPLGGQVFVYRPGAPVERLKEPESVSADPVLPGFRLELGEDPVAAELTLAELTLGVVKGSPWRAGGGPKGAGEPATPLPCASKHECPSHRKPRSRSSTAPGLTPGSLASEPIVPAGPPPAPSGAFHRHPCARVSPILPSRAPRSDRRPSCTRMQIVTSSTSGSDVAAR